MTPKKLTTRAGDKGQGRSRYSIANKYSSRNPHQQLGAA